ncbi:hypothetical protein WA1_32610 [Scytonema hofmannii PCC 7110]|uniref:DUF4114 domain-containing protein n=1 Tax=Scytonema hofmannii PCC 7110 TaxID=128403 RepID=A0A139X485_9CYAN|nr:PEP-CTERM domain protein [Scytonema hofmannii]KYC39463.1 hypothetical protein WA1_32610 [Scytonema hofmannii PCC 7110]
MKNNRFTEVFAAIATAGTIFSVVAPVSAASLNNTSEWNNLVANQVQPRATDVSGFQTLIPQFQQFVQPEGIAIPDNQVRRLDPSRLQLKSDSNVRVWFLNEGAFYRNQLAYEAIQGSNYQAELVFQDASCISGNNNNCEKPSSDGTLNVGDYVDLGTVTGGSQLNFWLRANGANPQDTGGTNPATNVKNIYSEAATQNPDGLEHIVAYEYNDYLLVGFEDLFGPPGSLAGGNGTIASDRDFNDVVFVVDVGKNNLDDKAYIPEPTSALAILGVGAVGLLKLSRRRINSDQ